MIPFPKLKYRPHPAYPHYEHVHVANELAEDALEGDWYDRPGDFPAVPAAVAEPASDQSAAEDATPSPKKRRK